jgi:hypothetical protein
VSEPVVVIGRNRSGKDAGILLPEKSCDAFLRDTFERNSRWFFNPLGGLDIEG